ncbi:uncharacterized protein N0V89_003238 [Didymosphaeria variabile]|uniref:Uncharacterized protein n=1 Tax=Didymosphaeria variabile TaxID=1932322 RepID=A0A9W8XU50_9PLEO|nr:uncharacterized protein N0V89_003238 [Didymosphaeria variabile]KAJ4358654.1 hypothetical protein N0V89_003238 [Didymosphaeria variabile]
MPQDAETGQDMPESMSHSGVNMAVTEDGAAYNKLRRPDDYLQSLTAQYPAKSELPPAKRKFEAVATADHEDGQAPNTKRSREEHASAGATCARAVAGDKRRVFRPVKENGMQTMFPGLDDDSASDEDDTTRDALAYLRSVRSEASTIPTLLVAPPQAPRHNELDHSMYHDGVGDHRAVYQDGTWVAVDEDVDVEYYDEDEDWSQYEDDINPQEGYYTSLLRRYKALRSTLANADPKELAALVKADPEKYANVRVPYYKSDWRYAFDNKYPTPALVAQIDEKSLYRTMEYVSEVLITGDTISKQKSCWIWTLLALAGDSGTLDYYKVGRIRELGHKAGQLSIRLRSGVRRDADGVEKEGDAEDWEVEGEGVDEDEQDENENGKGAEAKESRLTPEVQRHAIEDGEGGNHEEEYEPPTDIGGQSYGATEQKLAVYASQPSNKGHEEKNISISEDEGEIEEDEPEVEDTPADLEAARARLLAQLGENLVTEAVPNLKIPAHQLRGKQAHVEPRQGGRHRHNGKWCKELSCQMNKGRQEAHRKAALRATKGVMANRSRSETSLQSRQDTQSAANQQRQNNASEEPPAPASADASTYEPAVLSIPQATEDTSRSSAIENEAEALGEAPAAEKIDPAAFLIFLHSAIQGDLSDGEAEILREFPPELALEAHSFFNRDDGTGTDEDFLRQLPPDIAASVREGIRINRIGSVSERRAIDVEWESSSDREDERRVEEVDLNTRVTIDMILTVVGECYGQRDLLKFREVW